MTRRADPISERRTRRVKQPLDAPVMPVELIAATSEPDLVNIPARVVLAIDGEGPPDAPAFASALGALYGVAYTLKFARAKSGRHGFSIGALEGRWSAAGAPTAKVPPRDAWRWRLRLAIPADVDSIELELAKATVLARRGGKLAGSQIVPHVFVEVVPRQRLARILHVGPYSREAASLSKLDALLVTAGLGPARSHVEVYLSDPRRTPSSKLRTVLLRELAEQKN